MKKIIALTMIFYTVSLAYSQTDSLLLKYYEQKVLEISKLKNDLQTEKQNYSDLKDAYNKDTIALQKQIKDLRKEVSSEKQKVLELNKNKIIEDRDNLQNKLDSLNTEIERLNKIILEQILIIEEKDNQIINEKANTIIASEKAKNAGKAEALANVVNLYKNYQFDDIIKSSTNGTVARDIQLFNNDQEVKSVLNDLQIFFNAQALLSRKIDIVQIKKAQTQLSQINRQSKLLEALKDDIEFYEDFNSALKEIFTQLVKLDKNTLADGDSDIHKLKFNIIVTILTDYMYNYYDYSRYPYLSDIVIEIIKRKQPNADADISDLLKKL
jgi:hypothetical protein